MVTFSGPISTSRLNLRPYEPGDLAFLRALYGREDVCRYLPWTPMDGDQARAKLEQRMGQTHLDEDDDPLVLVADERDTGRTVGEFMLRLKSRDSGQGEIGWTVHPDFQGRGFATEGARELLRLGFDELRLHRIAAGCDARNTASLRVMDRLGLRREAAFIQSDYLKGEWVDEIVAAMLVTEWRAQARP